MSLYGSTSRLATMGQRSNSRPDLSTFRNDGFLGGNGFMGEYQVGDGGGYSHQTSSFSRHTIHGGGGSPGLKVSGGMGMGLGGGGGTR